MENIDEVLEFYNAGAEKGRLERGLGKVELYRTKEILGKYINSSNNVIYDVGGGIGIYSSWLANMNNEVHLLELSPWAVEYAKKIKVMNLFQKCVMQEILIEKMKVQILFYLWDHCIICKINQKEYKL